MKSERELLEAAAKAAGYTDAKYKDMEGWGEVRYGLSEAVWSEKLYEEDGSGYWNPLADNDQAFRLAVRLKLEVAIWADGSGASAAPDGSGRKGPKWHFEDEHNHNGDLAAATRLAIVRAAAAMAEESPA